MKRTLFWLVLVFGGVIGIFCIWALVFGVTRKEKNLDVLLAKRDYYLAHGGKFQAYSVMREAADLQPQNSRLQRDAGILALESGKKETANAYLNRAWEAGERDIKTMAALVESSSLPVKDKRKYLFSLIDQVPDPVRADELRAFAFFQHNDYEKAEVLFRKLFQGNHKTVAGEYLARCLIGAKMPDQAREFLKAAASQGRLGPSGLVILLPLLTETDEDADADRFYRLCSEKGLSPDELRLTYGYNLFNRRKYEEATQTLAPLVTPIRYVAADVTSAVELVADIKAMPQMLAGKSDERAPGLTLSLRTRDLLAISKPDEFELAEFSLSLVTDLNAYCFFPGVTGAVSAARIQELETLFPTGLTRPRLNETAHAARLILTAICCYTNNPGGGAQLRTLAAGQTRWLEGERYVYQALFDQTPGPQKLEKECELFDSAAELLPDNPIVWLLAGDACLRLRRFSAAIEYYSAACRVNPSFKNNPQLIEHLASALLGERRYVVALRMIDSLHRRGYRSRNSLELMRDLGYRADMSGVSLDAQKLLEQTYAGDWRIVLDGGDLLCAVNKPAEALTVYRRVYEQAKEPAIRAAAQQGILEALLRTRKLQEILAQQLPEEIAGGYQAAAYALLGQDQQAIALFDRLVRTERMTPAWRLMYAAILQKNRRPLDALGQLVVLLRQNPGDEAAHSEMAGLLADMGDYRAAREHAQIVLEHNESQTKALLVIAITDLYRQNAKNAERICQDLLRQNSADVTARYFYACALNHLHKYDQALKEIGVCLEHDNSNLDYLRQRIEALSGKEDYAAAWDALIAASMRHPQDHNLQHAKVALSIRAGKFARAEDELARATLLDAQEKLLLRSQVAYQQGDLAAALRVLEDGLGQIRVDFRWAEIAYELGRKTELLSRLNVMKLEVRSYVLLAERAEAAGDFAFARELYRLGLRRAPDDPVILNNYAWASFRTGRGREPDVYAAARKAVELCPDSPEVLATCGEVTNACGNFSETIMILGRAPHRLFSNAQLLGLIASAYEGTGRYVDALKAYQRMRNIDALSPYSLEQIEERINKLKEKMRNQSDE